MTRSLQGEAQLEVSKALYTRLNAATATGQPLAGVGVHDAVTQASGFPYIVIGEMFPTDYSDKDDAGQELIVQIHVWSQKTSSLEIKTIQAAIYNLLHLAPLTVTGQINYLIRFQSAVGLQVDPDSITRHAVLKYRLLTQAQA